MRRDQSPSVNEQAEVLRLRCTITPEGACLRELRNGLPTLTTVARISPYGYSLRRLSARLADEPKARRATRQVFKDRIINLKRPYVTRKGDQYVVRRTAKPFRIGMVF